MTLRQALCFGILFLQMAGCGFEAAPTSTFDGKMEAREGVVYGADSILDVPKVTANSKLSVALVKNDQWQIYNSLQSQKQKNEFYTVSEVYGIEGVAWSTQPSLAYCSGLFLGKDLVLTAGHCLQTQEDCNNTQLVFNFELNSSEATALRCKKIIKSKNSIQKEGLDFALIQMEKAVDIPGVGLPKKKAEPSLSNQRIYALGYPLGSFKKISSGKVRKVMPKSGVLVSNLDVFEGNSGSPVFSAKTHELVGILSSGEGDFVKNDENDSEVSIKKCSNRGCSGEFITPIQKIIAEIYK